MVLVKKSHVSTLRSIIKNQEGTDILSERELKLYNSLVHKIHTSSTIQELRVNILSGLQQLIPYQSAAFFLVNPHTTDFSEPLLFGLDAESYSAYRDYYQAYDIYKKAVFSRGSIPITDRSSDYMDYHQWEQNVHRADFLIPQGIYHIACLQVFHQGILCGEVSLHRSRRDHDFYDKEMLILDLLHEQVSSRFSILLALQEELFTDINTFKDPAQNLFLCFLDSHYKLQAATPTAIDLLPQTLVTGETVYSRLKDACYCLALEHAKPNAVSQWYSSSLLRLKQSFCHFQIFLLQDELLRDRICYLILLRNHPDKRESVIDKWVLTKREAEIASLLTRGRTNKQIAAELGVSENTIKTFVKRMFIKLGVHSRSELISEIYKLTPPANHPLAE